MRRRKPRAAAPEYIFDGMIIRERQGARALERRPRSELLCIWNRRIQIRKALPRCCELGCGALAEWIYANDLWRCCDLHVPRGCSCQLERRINGDPRLEERRDDIGRLRPCVDYMFRPEELEYE